MLWKPLPGPQTQALQTQADELFYGGAAGGGKTDLILGCALTQHQQAIIFRREYKQLRGILERSRTIIGPSGRLNEQTNLWRIGSERTIEFGAVKDESDKDNFQGRPHDFVGFDEVTQFTQSQFRFLMGWNRTTIKGQRTRVIATGNPPTSTEGQWVVAYWAPWLDETHSNPAEPGELRWFAVLDGHDIEVDGPEPFSHKGETIYPKSRTFIPARLQDNPFLTHDASYVATLQGMEEPLRTQMLYGDFRLGLIEDRAQLIPTAHLRAAKALGEVEYDPTGGALVAGVDVAGPGDNETVCFVRQGSNLLASYSTVEREMYGDVLGFLRDFIHRGLTQVNIDPIGVGEGLYLYLKEHLDTVTVDPVNVGEAPTTKELAEKRLNLRAELYWNLRERFEAGEIAGITDPVLISQLSSLKYKRDNKGRVVIESKEDMAKRGIKSPDRADTLMLAFAPPSRDQRLVQMFRKAAVKR